MQHFLVGSLWGGLALFVNGHSPELKSVLIFLAGGGLWLLVFRYASYVQWRLRFRKRERQWQRARDELKNM